MMQKDTISVFWFRRDLRLHDNAGLHHALKGAYPVLPVFIFDKNILDKLEDKQDKRLVFIHQAIQTMQEQLIGLGSSMKALYGFPLECLQQLSEQYIIRAIFTNHDYEPYARERDNEIQAFCLEKGIEFRTFKDQCIFEKKEVLSNTHTPYTVYSPYGRKWRSELNHKDLEAFRTEHFFGNFYKQIPQKIITLSEMGFQHIPQSFPSKILQQKLLTEYAEKRNIPNIEATSRLSVHLRFGTISIRQVAQKALAHSQSFLNELTWRDFYMMILYNFPHAATKAFKKEYENIAWRNDETEFAAWCEGKTGYPIVDAGIRELNETGFMHNRVRMITASFLTKHLLIDWRWGEAYFAKKLLDFDLSANNGGWQWASSSGCDAAPYFRIFNPSEQTKKFDPELLYIKRWVPEWSDFSYPKPMVEHSFARQRALETYKKALTKQL